MLGLGLALALASVGCGSDGSDGSGDADSDADGDADADSDGGSDADTDSDMDADTDSDSDADSDADADSDTDADVDCEAFCEGVEVCGEGADADCVKDCSCEIETLYAPAFAAVLFDCMGSCSAFDACVGPAIAGSDPSEAADANISACEEGFSSCLEPLGGCGLLGAYNDDVQEVELAACLGGSMDCEALFDCLAAIDALCGGDPKTPPK